MPQTEDTISDSVIQRLRDLSEMSSNNPQRICAAMMAAIKSSFTKMRTNCIITFLKNLKNSGIGTNEVEHNILRTCALMKDQERHNIKMKLMRYKIRDAYK